MSQQNAAAASGPTASPSAAASLDAPGPAPAVAARSGSPEAARRRTPNVPPAPEGGAGGSTGGPAGGAPRPPQGSPVALAAVLAGFVLVGWLWGWSMLVVIGAIVVTIALHELGHYLTAKWSGMKVTEFFLGFGPRIWSFHRGETDYGVKALPAGAYVKIIGMSSYEEVDPADEARTYRQQSYPRRLAVAVAGSAMHFLIALLLIFVLLAGFGTPGGSRLFQEVQPSRWTVNEVVAGTAAAAAGLRAGDRIVSVDGVEVPAWADLGAAVRPRPGEPVTLVVDRDGRQLSVQATLAAVVEDGETIGRLGVQPNLEYPPVERVSPIQAVPDTLRDFGSLVGGTISGLGKVFSPSGMSSFAHQVFNARESAEEPASGSSGSATSSNEDDGRLVSIIGATRIGARLLDDGAADFLRFMVVLNVFIGLFNLVPLLPLDGGHVAIATYERIREIGRGGRRYFVDVTRLLPVTYAVVTVLVLIGVSSIYLDVVNPISIP